MNNDTPHPVEAAKPQGDDDLLTVAYMAGRYDKRKAEEAAKPQGGGEVVAEVVESYAQQDGIAVVWLGDNPPPVGTKLYTAPEASSKGFSDE